MRSSSPAALSTALASLTFFAALPGPAAAAHHDLSFAAGPVWTASFDSGGTHFDEYIFQLGELAPPLTLAAGDSITATIDFTPDYTLPYTPSVYLVSFVFALIDPRGGFPEVSTTTSGTLTFRLDGSDVLNVGTGTGSVGQVAFGAGLRHLPVPTLNQVQADFTISALPVSGDVTYAAAYFTNFSPAVPEPAPASLLLVGLGVGAYALRRRRS